MTGPNRDDASVMVGGPLLDVAHLVGQPNATAFHDPLARVTLNRFSIPSSLGLDLYTLLAYRLPRLDRDLHLRWSTLQEQLGL